MLLVNLSDDLSRSWLAPVFEDCCDMFVEFVSYCPLSCACIRAEFDRWNGEEFVHLPDRDHIRV